MQTAANTSRKAAMLVLLIGAFLPPLDFFIVNLALPSIRVAALAEIEPQRAGLAAGVVMSELQTGAAFGVAGSEACLA
jgi:hypothetical protein